LLLHLHLVFALLVVLLVLFGSLINTY